MRVCASWFFLLHEKPGQVRGLISFQQSCRVQWMLYNGRSEVFIWTFRKVNQRHLYRIRAEAVKGVEVGSSTWLTIRFYFAYKLQTAHLYHHRATEGMVDSRTSFLFVMQRHLDCHHQSFITKTLMVSLLYGYI